MASRRPYTYPTEDTDLSPEGIDEEEQETVIHNLRTVDADTTQFYTYCFLALPLSCVLFYLRAFLWPTSYATWLGGLLSITSLACTAWILYAVPLPPPEKLNKGKQPAGRPQSGIPQVKMNFDAFSTTGTSPIEQAIIPLNGVLAGILAIHAWFAPSMRNEQAWVWGVLPGVCYMLVLNARLQLRPVGWGELEGLRYEYKGA